MASQTMTLVEQGGEHCDRKRLQSALQVLQQAQKQARRPSELVLSAYQLGALHWSELGNGVEARRLFQATVEEANRVALEARPAPVLELEANASENLMLLALANACENLMLLALSYDDYESWAERLRALQPDNDILRGQVPWVRDKRERGHPWSDVMLSVASSYYTRGDPARDPGRYGSAKSVYHLALVNRKALRLPRADWKRAAGEYSILAMRIAADCARTLERNAGPSGPDTREFTFVMEEAIPLVAEYVTEYPQDGEVKEGLDRLSKLFREAGNMPPQRTAYHKNPDHPLITAADWEAAHHVLRRFLTGRTEFEGYLAYGQTYTENHQNCLVLGVRLKNQRDEGNDFCLYKVKVGSGLFGAKYRWVCEALSAQMACFGYAVGADPASAWDAAEDILYQRRQPLSSLEEAIAEARKM
ncbi:MAG: hypothetical protein ACHRXM_00805 [Isosphaerales bacterium]